MDDSVSDTQLVSITFWNRWAICSDILIVIQDYFAMYTKQALEFLKIEQGFSTLVWSTLGAVNS